MLGIARILTLILTLTSVTGTATPGQLGDSLAGVALAGQVDDGLAAYNRGDYATAMKLWLPLAEQGNEVAQNNIGVLYAQGRGVEQNYTVAANWFRKSANQGYANAQFNLGFIYYNGNGVAQD
jgi:hypothetical protein